MAYSEILYNFEKTTNVEKCMQFEQTSNLTFTMPSKYQIESNTNSAVFGIVI